MGSAEAEGGGKGGGVIVKSVDGEVGGERIIYPCRKGIAGDIGKVKVMSKQVPQWEKRSGLRRSRCISLMLGLEILQKPKAQLAIIITIIKQSSS